MKRHELNPGRRREDRDLGQGCFDPLTWSDKSGHPLSPRRPRAGASEWDPVVRSRKEKDWGREERVRCSESDESGDRVVDPPGEMAPSGAARSSLRPAVRSRDPHKAPKCLLPASRGGSGRSQGSGDRIRWVGSATLPYSDEQRHFLAAGIQLRVCGFGRIAARQDGYCQTPQQHESGMAASPFEPAYPALRLDSFSARLSFAHRILDASHTFYRQFLGRNER